MNTTPHREGGDTEINKVMVGFDGREQSRDALALGSSLARAEGAQLLVACIYAVGPMLEGTDYDPVIDPAFESGEERLARAERVNGLFAEVERELDGAPFVRCEALGSPARCLDEIAEDENVDLIVLGSTHQGKLGRVYPGSTAERLMSGGPCAVAVAPRGFARREHSGLGIIGVGYDGAPESKLALRAAAELARRLDASLRLIAVLREPQPSRLRGPYISALRERLAEVLREGASSVEGIEVECVLPEAPNPAAALADQGVELDLLVVGSRGYGPLRRALLGGVSGDVVRMAPCPVLVTPRGSAPDVKAPQSGPAQAAV